MPATQAAMVSEVTSQVWGRTSVDLRHRYGRNTVVARGTAILSVVKKPNDAINQPYCSIAAMAIQCAVSSSTRTCRTRSANGPPPGIISNGRSDAVRIGARSGIRLYRLPPSFTTNGEVDCFLGDLLPSFIFPESYIARL